MNGRQTKIAKKVDIVLRAHWAYVRKMLAKGNLSQKYFSSKKEKLAIRAVLRNIKLLSSYLPEIGKREFKILDVGVGTGKLPVVLKALGYDVYGLDDNGGGTRTSDFLRRMFPHLKVEVCSIEFKRFPYKDNEFDLVTSLDVVEHLPGSPRHYLREIYRIIKSGGTFLLSNPNPASLSNAILILLGKSVYHPLEEWFDLVGNENYQGHWREYTASELTYMVSKVGFRVIKKCCRPLLIDFSSYSITSKILLVCYLVLTYLMPSMRNEVFIICTKPEMLRNKNE